MVRKTATLLIFFLSAAYVQAQKPAYIDDKIRSQIALEFYGSTGFTDYKTGLVVASSNEDVTVSFGSGTGIGLRYGTLISKKMQFSLGAYYQYSKFSQKLTNASGGIPRFNLNPNLRYFINMKNMRSRFYGGAGILVSVGTSYNMKATDPQYGPIDLKFKYKTAVGPTLEIGYEKFLASYMSIDFTLKYHYLSYSLNEASNAGKTIPTSQLNGSYYDGFVHPDGQAIDFIIALKYCF